MQHQFCRDSCNQSVAAKTDDLLGLRDEGGDDRHEIAAEPLDFGGGLLEGERWSTRRRNFRTTGLRDQSISDQQ